MLFSRLLLCTPLIVGLLSANNAAADIPKPDFFYIVERSPIDSPLPSEISSSRKAKRAVAAENTARDKLRKAQAQLLKLEKENGRVDRSSIAGLERLDVLHRRAVKKAIVELRQSTKDTMADVCLVFLLLQDAIADWEVASLAWSEERSAGSPPKLDASDALKTFEQVAGIANAEPWYGKIQYLIGWIHNEAHENYRAEVAWRRALLFSREPLRSAIHMHLGLLALEDGDLSTANRDFSAVVSGKQYAYAQFEMARVLAQRGDCKSAKRAQDHFSKVTTNKTAGMDEVIAEVLRVCEPRDRRQIPSH